MCICNKVDLQGKKLLLILKKIRAPKSPIVSVKFEDKSPHKSEQCLPLDSHPNVQQSLQLGLSESLNRYSF